MATKLKRTIEIGADDCKLAREFSSFSTAEEAVTKAINAYNTDRPHASLNYLTPNQMHQRKRKPKLRRAPERWYPYKKSGTEMYNMRPPWRGLISLILISVQLNQ